MLLTSGMVLLRKYHAEPYKTHTGRAAQEMGSEHSYQSCFPVLIKQSISNVCMLVSSDLRLSKHNDWILASLEKNGYLSTEPWTLAL